MSTILRLLHNPLAVKLALLAVICISLFLLAILVIRRLRRNIQAEAAPVRVAEAGLALAACDGLARQLREQAQEVQRLREQYQAEVAVAGNITETALANLNCGVLFFDRMGILRQANRAAKSLLGYSSPFSLHLRDVFRGVSRIRWTDDAGEAQSGAPLIQAMQETLRSGAALPRIKVDYRTPSGEKRVLGVSGSAVMGKGGEVMGISCLIDDLTEISELAQEVQRNESLASLGEISAGLIHDFKKSLATVREQAQALLKDRPGPSTQLTVEKMVAELDSLGRIVDEFLEFASPGKK